MIEIAKEAAIEAGKIALKTRLSGITAKQKEGIGNFSTEGDILAEKKILEIIKSKFPNHDILKEESKNSLKGSEFLWVVDPIDGTILYYSGQNTFGISIALFKNNQPLLGVLNFPALNLIFEAEKGKGTLLNGGKIKVSKEARLEKSIVATDFGYSNREKDAREILIPLVDKVRYIPVPACTVMAMSYVAQGMYQGYVHRAPVWDFAAATLIVEEAGGKVTNFKGKPVDWSQDWVDIVASNGLIHNQILEVINKK
jgi:myo-inositol-1(or 4)-monophosphatase